MSARPTVFQATEHDELTRRLSTRFEVRPFASGALALAHLVSGAPDVLVVAAADPTLGERTIAALKSSASTAWVIVVVIGDGAGDLVVRASEVGKIGGELAAVLGLDA